MRKPHENELGELHELATLLDTWQPESPETDLWPLLATQASGDQAPDPSDEFTLTAEQERGLAQRIERGGEDAEKARDILVNANLRLVTSIAKMYENKGIAMADLIQEGTLGLIHATEKYDGAVGSGFRPMPPRGFVRRWGAPSKTPPARHREFFGRHDAIQSRWIIVGRVRCWPSYRGRSRRWWES